MSDDEDYDSEDILKQCLAAASSSSSTNIRGDAPQSEKRKRELWKRQQLAKEEQDKAKKAKKEKAREAVTTLEKGLSTAIEPTNKGFQLLAKMGYEPGKALGIQPNARTEPIKPIVKANRFGLGKPEEENKKHEKLISEMQERASKREEMLVDFRSQKSQLLAEKIISRDLSNAQKACRTQDVEAGMVEPRIPWFWPLKPPDETDVQDEEESEEETLSDGEKLMEITEYLRTLYNYCVWCGIRFEGPSELDGECPGNSREAHD
ncbi:unnamed protein product [Notodromas monacha]|uniref:G patch domain-containing protein 11 n=1 Tax=Notodromas monacha TaxID=399045 RepID=A0A7R9C2M1_9CRUS|nr:unnamed protein product [Notodromas monacha]CAD7284849.1 unnamed protein product [Notodromas monacha]CAG0919994.1 unnamed protein product [Notodromas monacha]CAG0925001.1 unnamed protein product [Notodromas monacha]